MIKKFLRVVNRSLVILPLFVLPLLASQSSAQNSQSMTWINKEGSREVLDLKTGWTETPKSGKPITITPDKISQLCSTLEEAPRMFNSNEMEWYQVTQLCENWGELKPKTQIEHVHFSNMLMRALVISANGSTFKRYRGAQLASNKISTVFDATIVPDDLGPDVSCQVVEAKNPPEGMMYQFRCSITTMSYPAAVEVEKVLVGQLKGLDLIEDQVMEHGLSVGDKGNNECAMTGECEHGHMYVSTLKHEKRLVIQAKPDFIRNLALDIDMLQKTGRHNFVESVSPDRGSVEVTIYSYRPAANTTQSP